MWGSEFAGAQPSTNVPFLAVCATVILFLLGLLVAYSTNYPESPPIVAILALLILNHFFMLLFEVPGYLEGLPNWACLASVLGTTFFRLASYYWLIFVTRLVYHEKAAPGKFIDLSKYVSRNVVFTYIPSVLVTLMVLVVANLDDTQSELSCWRIISEKTISDYVIYLSCFVLPSLVALMLVVVFLLAVLLLKDKSSNSLCLFFPLTALPFMGYDLVLRLMTFFGEWSPNQLLEIPLVCQALCHGAIFFLVLRNLSQGRRPASPDLTIQEESNKNEIFLGSEQA